MLQNIMTTSQARLWTLTLTRRTSLLLCMFGLPAPDCLDLEVGMVLARADLPA